MVTALLGARKGAPPPRSRRFLFVSDSSHSQGAWPAERCRLVTRGPPKYLRTRSPWLRARRLRGAPAAGPRFLRLHLSPVQLCALQPPPRPSPGRRRAWGERVRPISGCASASLGSRPGPAHPDRGSASGFTPRLQLGRGYPRALALSPLGAGLLAVTEEGPSPQLPYQLVSGVGTQGGHRRE